VTFRLQWTDNPPSILDLTEEFSKAGGVRSLPFTVEKKTGEPGTIELTAKLTKFLLLATGCCKSVAYLSTVESC